MKEKPTVIVTRKLPEPVETRMMELFDTRLREDDRPWTADELAQAAGRCDVLVPTVTDRIDEAVIAAAGPRLKLIASFGAGVDHVDLKAAAAKGILVTSTPGVLTEDTADMAIALLLATARRLVEGDRVVRAGAWAGWSPSWMLGARIRGKRLGIIGMGRIGLAVATRARAFGLAIHYHNRHRHHSAIERDLEATYWHNLDQMLARMDIISVNCPLTPATHHLLCDRKLALVQPHAIIINTARGEVIDQDALARRLEDRSVGGAGLDVFGSPPVIDPRLLALDNVVLTPHMSSATLEGRIEMGEKVVINIRTFWDGHRPPDRVIAGLL